MRNNTFQPFPAPLCPVKPPATHFSHAPCSSLQAQGVCSNTSGVWHVMIPEQAVSELSSGVQGSELLPLATEHLLLPAPQQLLHPLLENTGETQQGRAARTLQTSLVPILSEEIKKM